MVSLSYVRRWIGGFGMPSGSQLYVIYEKWNVKLRVKILKRISIEWILNLDDFLDGSATQVCENAFYLEIRHITSSSMGAQSDMLSFLGWQVVNSMLWGIVLCSLLLS